MMLRVLGGALSGALALMLSGYVYWAVLLPSGTALREVPDQAGLARVLGEFLPAGGTYFIPHAPAHGEDGHDEDAHHAAALAEVKGVVAMVHFDPQGGNPLSVRTYLLSFAHFLLSALLASLLLAAALPALKSYARRAAFVFGLALFAAFAVRLADPIWYRLPWSYFVYSLIYLVAGWGLAALAIAALVRPAR
jgi:hypothetical protein